MKRAITVFGFCLLVCTAYWASQLYMHVVAEGYLDAALKEARETAVAEDRLKRGCANATHR